MTYTEEYKEHIEYTFHAFCRVVIRNAMFNALRNGTGNTKEKYPLTTSQMKSITNTSQRRSRWKNTC